MFPATDILRDEHRLILRAIDLLDQGATTGRGRAPSDGWWDALSQWLRGFADRNHHTKEELQARLDQLAAELDGMAGGHR